MSQLAVLPKEQHSALHQEPPVFSVPFQLLDVYAPEGTVDATPRVDHIATISAGEKDGNAKFPTRSKDGNIILHDSDNRAPELRKALAETGFKSLTIAFPFDDMSMMIHQYFAEYSASNLLAWGDATQITVLDPQRVGRAGRIMFLAGSKEYRDALDRCKVHVSVYFHLARWTDDGPEVYFPDGLGLYRLRFTSRNSLRSIVGSLQTTAKYTNGRLAGIPFQLSLENIEVAGSDGAKRKIPVWRSIMKAPNGFSLSSQNFREVAEKALAQGSALSLPAPRIETLELAMQDGAEADLDDISEEQFAEVAMGGKCDAAHFRRTWFALTQDTPLDLDEARADFVSWYSATYNFEVVSSLAKLLDLMNEEQALGFIKAAQDELAYQLDEAKVTYGNLLRAGVALGIKERALPEDAQFVEVANYTSSLKKAIDRKVAQGTEASTPRETVAVQPAQELQPPEEQEVPEGEVTELAPPQTLSSAIADKVEQARIDVPHEGSDLEWIFAGTESTPVVDDGGDGVPEHIQFFMNWALDKGAAHNGDFSSDALLGPINDWRAGRRNPLPPISDVLAMSKSDVNTLVVAVGKGQITFGLV